MKSAAFNQMIAEHLTMPLSTVTDYARRLKEAGMLSTAPRGAPAPDMTGLDAARLVLAILSTPSPAQCVERVQRFGRLPFSPDLKRGFMRIETIGPEEFSNLFGSAALEDVLAELLDKPLRLGISEACGWYQRNAFGLRVRDFEVLAELTLWDMQDGKVRVERTVPFKGQTIVKAADGEFRHIEEFTPIPGGVRSAREVAPITLSGIAIALWADTQRQSQRKNR